MALSRDSRLHFTTIASFVSKLPIEMEDLFAGVLALCDEMGLIGRRVSVYTNGKTLGKKHVRHGRL